MVEAKIFAGGAINSEPLLSVEPSSAPAPCGHMRYVMTLLAGLGISCAYIMRVNLSVAVMPIAGELWDGGDTELRKGLLLASFFIGYTLTQFPGGVITARYGGKWVLACGMLGTAVGTALTPAAARHSFYTLFALRIAEGFFEGVTYPCLAQMFQYWAPAPEKTRMMGMAFSGSMFGLLIGFPGTAVLVDSRWGWPSAFYASSLVTVVWATAWLTLVASSPSVHPFISAGERAYIESTAAAVWTAPDRSAPLFDPAVPWKRMLTMRIPAVNAIIAANFANSFAVYLFMTWIPSYFKDLGFQIKTGGFLSVVPFLTFWVFAMISSDTADRIRVRGWLNTTQTRKMYQAIATLAPAVILVVLALGFSMHLVPGNSGVDANGDPLVHPHRGAAVVLASCAIALTGCVTAGFQVNPLDLGGHSGATQALSNTFGSIAGVIAPQAVGHIVNGGKAGEWAYVFIMVACIKVVGCTLFCWLATGKPIFSNNPELRNKEPVFTRAISADEEAGPKDWR